MVAFSAEEWFALGELVAKALALPEMHSILKDSVLAYGRDLIPFVRDLFRANSRVFESEMAEARSLISLETGTDRKPRPADLSMTSSA